MAEWSETVRSDSTWRVRDLALVSLYFAPGLTRARAELAAARAAEISAGARPQPGVRSDIERTFSGDRTGDPWGVGLSVVLTLELGGKRGARVARARARTLAREAALRAEAWEIVEATRRAAFQLTAASVQADAVERVQAALDQARPLAQKRFEESAITRAELARLDAETQAAAFESAGARSEIERAGAELSKALFLRNDMTPTAATLRDSIAGCDLASEVAPDSLERIALTARWRLREAQADYAASEAELREQVAKQYPDLELGPGLLFDHGENKWTLAFGLPQLLLNRNRGSIAEAEANRRVVAARFVELQEGVLGEVDAARTNCRAARSRALASEQLITGAAAQRSIAEQAFQRGEITQFDRTLAEALVAQAERARLQARSDDQRAGLELERTLGIWAPIGASWPDPTVPGNPSQPKGER